MITIIDYGMGNLGSIQNMFKRIGVKSEITAELQAIKKAKKILLPGVGAFDHAIKTINSIGLREVLDHKALEERIPILGICLGMQLLTSSSEEGSLPGFNWIKAKTIRFPSSKTLKVPHMGWNLVKKNHDSPLITGLDDESRFYFVHSYYVKVEDRANSMMSCDYGISFDAVISSKNIFGAQFHPEKSHKYGMQLLQNFAGLPC